MTRKRISAAAAAAEYHPAMANVLRCRAALYEAIRYEHAHDGKTMRALAVETGLSFPRVQQIIAAGKEGK